MGVGRGALTQEGKQFDLLRSAPSTLLKVAIAGSGRVA
jgi:hypothetical protein